MGRFLARMGYAAVYVCCLVAAASCLASAIASLVPDTFDYKTPIPQLAALLIPLSLAAALLAIVSAIIVRKRFLTVSLLISAFVGLALMVGNAWQAAGGSLHLGVPTTEQNMSKMRETDSLRVMTLNAYIGNADAQRITSLARDLSVDVLCLQEVTPDLQARLEAAGLREILPYKAGGAPGDQIWTHLPLSGAVEDAVGYSGSSMAGATLQTPVGNLRVVSVHTCAPLPKYDRLWKQSLRDVASLPAKDPAGDSDDAYLLAGDFNATLANASLRTILSQGLVDAAAQTGTWWHGTWPAPVSFATLDHVLLPAGFGAQRIAYVSVDGTDHIGVITDVKKR